ncbi:hypothetical protein LNA01_18770 [Companilactobacillus nantensis]|nr:hypothetical protein LNA01_18770 [Companilactobacillus nantensis]
MAQGLYLFQYYWNNQYINNFIEINDIIHKIMLKYWSIPCTIKLLRIMPNLYKQMCELLKELIFLYNKLNFFVHYFSAKKWRTGD